MLVVLLVVIAAIATSLVAAWWQGTSRRATEAAERAESLARKNEEGKNFLQLVTESQPTEMSIIDKEGTYQWANREAWSSHGLTLEQVVGKPLAAVVGPIPAKEIMRMIAKALNDGGTKVKTHKVARGEKHTPFNPSSFP